MSEAFVFISTKQTYPLSVPQFAVSEADFRRNVSNAFTAISGGFRMVGQIALFPTSAAVADHLLCDGSTISRDSFPQLVEYLNPGGSTATLPDYLSGFTFATSAPTQTISDGGTVTVGTPTPTPVPTGGQTGGSGQNVPSGGRPRNPAEAIP